MIMHCNYTGGDVSNQEGISSQWDGRQMAPPLLRQLPVYMKSTWTTFTDFVVRFDEDAKKPIATEIYTNKDPEQHASEKIDDKSDKYIVDSVIDIYLLKKFKK